MSYSKRGLRRAAWSPQQDVSQAAAWEQQNDPVQYNQRLMNEASANRSYTGAMNPQWARYFDLLDAKGARLAAARPNPMEHGIADDPDSSFNDNDYFADPALQALKKLVGR